MISRLKRILLGVLAALVVIGVAGWVLVHTLGDRLPRYDGRTLYQWLEQTKSQDSALSNQAVIVLQTKATPQLEDQMIHDTKDSSVRMALIDFFNNLPGLTIGFTPAPGRRATAATELGDLGPYARPAVPTLLEALKGGDSAVRGAAAEALGKIQSEPDRVIPVLTSYLKDRQEGVPEGAIKGLGGYGSLAQPALPRLLELSKIPDKDVQSALSVALKKIDPDGSARAALSDTNHAAR